MTRILTFLREMLSRSQRATTLLLLSACVLACLIAARGVINLRAPDPGTDQYTLRHLHYTYAEIASLNTLLDTLRINPFSPAAHALLAEAADHFYVRLQMLSGLSHGPFRDDSSQVKKLSLKLLAGLDDLSRRGPPLNTDDLAELGQTSARVLHLTGDYARNVEERVNQILAEDARRVTSAWLEIFASLTMMLVLSLISLSLFFRNRRVIGALRTAGISDSLTGLTNRRGFSDWAEEREREGDGNRQRHALLAFDIDRFKTVNDQFGHATGDRMLEAAARRLLADYPDAGLISRWGGDEFIVAVPLDELSLSEIGERLALHAATPSRIDMPSGVELALEMSCGIAVWPDNGSSVADALACADAALYQAKARKRGAHVFFRKEMLDHLLRQREVTTGLPVALQGEELHVVYEPRACINRNALVGARAHLRWHHPKLSETLAAADFMASAREHGQARAFDSFLLARACETAAGLLAATRHPAHVAVDLSACSLGDAGLAEEISALLQRCGLPPETLEVGLSGEAALSVSAEVTATLSRLAELGVRIALKTLDGGNAAMPLLARLRPQVLTINRPLLCENHSHTPDTMIASLSEMADTLGAVTLIEGVDTEADLNLARGARCALAEGRAISPPLAAEDLCRLFRDQEPMPVRERMCGTG